MCSIRLLTIVILIYVYLSFVTSARRYLNDAPTILDNDTAEIKLDKYEPVNKHVEKSVSAGVSLNTLKKKDDLSLQRNDELRTLDIDLGPNVSDSSVPEDGNETYQWTDISTLKQENLTSLCEEGLWIPLTIIITSSLQLEACLKFVVLNTPFTKPNFGYVFNSSLITDINGKVISISENYIRIEIHFLVDLCPGCMTLRLQIDKTDNNTYYWSSLELWGNIANLYINEKNDGLRKYETPLQSSYSCEFEDSIFLEKDVVVLIKNLKYRAFRTADSTFEDKDIKHCPSSFWIFASIGIFICILIIVTLVAIIWACCTLKGRGGYKKFERRFEP